MQYLLHDLIRLPLVERLRIIEQVLHADPDTSLVSEALSDVMSQLFSPGEAIVIADAKNIKPAINNNSTRYA